MKRTTTTDPQRQARRHAVLAVLRRQGLVPVCGGAPDDADQGDLTAEEREGLRNMRAWRAKQHREDERLKAERAQIEEARQNAAEERRELAALRAENAELRGGGAARGNGRADAGDDDYPNPVDDPEGFARRSRQTERSLRELIDRQNQTINDLRGEVQTAKQSVTSTVTGSGLYNRIALRNEQLFEDFATEHGLSKAEAEELQEYVQAFRIPNRGYGAYADGARNADGSRIWQYTKEALQSAANAAFPEKFADRIRTEERQRFEKERGPAGARTQGKIELGKNGVPAADADIGALAEYYYSLPPNSPATVAFMDALPIETAQQVMEHQIALEAGALGFEGAAPAGPVGVQEHSVEVL